MAGNFTKRIRFNGKTALAVIIPQFRDNGIYYEVNIQGYPRFNMRWSSLDRYDIASEGYNLPYELILAVSDAIEQSV
ncbi:MAG: hypothetical protein JNK00_10225 [Flavipsychrobacter sp.]|jgi:hypothetical protein|nr:hypothetical protein [Flavipsychrobacter sp.]